MKRGIKSTLCVSKKEKCLEAKGPFFSMKSVRKGFVFNEVENWIFSV